MNDPAGSAGSTIQALFASHGRRVVEVHVEVLAGMLELNAEVFAAVGLGLEEYLQRAVARSIDDERCFPKVSDVPAGDRIGGADAHAGLRFECFA